jgi:hypothetical protein
MTDRRSQIDRLGAMRGSARIRPEGEEPFVDGCSSYGHPSAVPFESESHPGGAATIWRNAETLFEIRTISRYVTFERIVGVIDDDLARKIAAAHDELFALGNRPHTFHDWSQVIGYSPYARKYLTAWLDASRGKLRSAHILFSSSLLAMGISVANAVLGHLIKAYGDSETFRAVMEQAQREA